MAKWKPLGAVPRALGWYRTRFGCPEGTGHVAVRMSGMGKGMVWVNGNNICRYWMTFASPLGKPTQSEYHIPRSFLNPQDNLLVIFEEEARGPAQVEILNVNRDTICSIVGEKDPANVNSWVSRRGNFHPVVKFVRPAASLAVQLGKGSWLWSSQALVTQVVIAETLLWDLSYQ